MITTSFVLIELGDGLARINQRQLALDMRVRLLESPAIEVVFVTRSLEELGWELYGNRTDKDWSVTDCVSFVLANDRSVEQAFTADHHFEQAGFTLLIDRK